MLFIFECVWSVVVLAMLDFKLQEALTGRVFDFVMVMGLCVVLLLLLAIVVYVYVLCCCFVLLWVCMC